MITWRAIYRLKPRRGKDVTMEYTVNAPTAGDVPWVVRKTFDFGGYYVVSVDIKRVTQQKAGVVASAVLR